MDRINGADFVDIGGGRRGFRDEDLPTGVPGTEVTALFLNMVQEEIAAVILDAGIALDPADWGQLLKALRARSAGRPSWVPVISMTVTAPPGAPANGDRYMVPPGATGTWAGHAYDIAEWTGVSWALTNHPDGHGISLPDGRVFIQIAGAYVEKLALDVQSGRVSSATDTGTAAALSVTLTPAPTAYSIGMELRVKAANACGPNPTINVNGLGAKTILGALGQAIVAKNWGAGDTIVLIYDGANFRLVSAHIAAQAFQAFQSYATTPITLTTADLGKFINFNNTASIVNLPLASTCREGTVLFLQNTTPNTVMTVQTQGGDDITIGASGAGAGKTSFKLMPTETIMLMAFSGSNNWIATWGSGQERYVTGFNSILGAAPGTLGWKRVPDSSSPLGYIIEQWGFLTVAAANVNTAIVFPTAFPNQLLSIVGSSGSAGVAAGATNNGSSLTGAYVWGGAASCNVFWRAIGY